MADIRELTAKTLHTLKEEGIISVGRKVRVTFIRQERWEEMQKTGSIKMYYSSMVVTKVYLIRRDTV